MTTVMAREGAEVYGARIGLLHVPCRIPFAPGGVGHLATYGYPVLMRTLDCPGDDLAGADVQTAAVDAARWLERQGVVGISSDCGTLIHHQRAVADVVSVPVALSPLLLLPFVLASVARSARVGVIAAVSTNVDDRQLALAGVTEPERQRLVIAGMEQQPAFRSAILEESGALDTEAVAREATTVAQELVARAPDVRALLFDCSDLPPYAEAVQAGTGRPVFDFITMIDHVARAARAVP